MTLFSRKIPFITTAFRANSFITFALHLTTVFLLLFLCRCTYFIYNLAAFGHLPFDELLTAFRGGALFDLAAIGYTNLLYTAIFFFRCFLPVRWANSMAYKVISAICFLVPNIVCIIVNIMDVGYFPFVLKRTTMTIFDEFKNDNLVEMTGGFALQYRPLTLMALFLIATLCHCYFRIVRYPMPQFLSLKSRGAHILRALVRTAFFVAIQIISIRGTFIFATSPMTPMKAYMFVESPADAPLVQNTLFTLFRTSNEPVLTEVKYFSPEELKNIYSPRYQATPLSPDDSLFGSFRDKNICIILLESFSREYIGSLNRPDHQGWDDGGVGEGSDRPYPGYTPHLDSLIARSLTYKYAFANGRRSVEVIPAALAGVPSLGLTFVTSSYGHNDLIGLPDLMKKNGYSSVFYHGGGNGTMGFDALVKKIGVKSYFGRSEYANDADFDGHWGIPDLPFLSRVADEINVHSKPMLSIIFTLSSHSPFIVPDPYKGQFPEGTLPMHPVVGYADLSLNEFFKKVETLPWYRKTLFILMADHAALSDNPDYKNTVEGRHAIPIIFFDPTEKIKPGLDTERIVQQSDILPTVLYLMGDTTTVNAYGHNIFDDHAEHWAIVEEEHHHYLITEAGRLVLDPNGKVSAFDLAPRVAPKVYEYDEVRLLDQYEAKFKAIVQDYNSRMRLNKLTYID